MQTEKHRYVEYFWHIKYVDNKNVLKKIRHRKILHIDGIFELAIRMCTMANSVR